MGNPNAIRNLKFLARDNKPSFIFLCKTSENSDCMENIRCQLGFQGMFCSDALGRSRGLALF